MSAPAFTKGPWKCDAEDPRYIRNVKTKEYIAARQSGNPADSDLIAAAPELYEALALFMRAGVGNSTDFPLQTKAYALARAALAKAVQP